MNGKRMVSVLIGLSFVAALVILGALSIHYRLDFFGDRQGVRKIEQMAWVMEGGGETIFPPVIMKGLAPRSPVVLQGEIKTQGAESRESLLVGSHFAPARIYLDDVLVYEFWQPGSYPSFMTDPPVGNVIIPLPENSGTVRLRIEYTSPLQRRELSIPAVYVGGEGALVSLLFYEKRATVLFSLVMLFFGLLLCFVWAVFLRPAAAGSSFLWLGLFSFSAGAWVFGECELSAFLFPYSALLYAMDYLGMFCVCIPLMRFWLDHPQARVKKPLWIMLYVHYVSVLVAVLLQLAGKVDLMKSLYWFHIISPLAFVVLAAVLLWEYFYCRNHTARYFAPAGLLLAIFVVLELMNYWLGMFYSLTTLFQMGLLTFIIWLGFLSGYFVRQSARAAFEKEQLAYEVTAMSRQLALQQEQYEGLMQNAAAVKALRHDMRHHIAVIKRLFLVGDAGDLDKYVADLEKGLADTVEKAYCANPPVNAIVSHYLDLSENEGVMVKTRLNIPVETGIVPAMELCII